MKVNNRVKQLLGACLAVGMLASLAACQRQDGPEQPTGSAPGCTTSPPAKAGSRKPRSSRERHHRGMPRAAGTAW